MSAAKTDQTHDLHPTASKKPKNPLTRGRRPHMTDTVEKGICRNLEATLIQDREAMRNLDSKIHFPGFVCFKIQFHISFAVTFSTVSTRKRRPGGRAGSNSSVYHGKPWCAVASGFATSRAQSRNRFVTGPRLRPRKVVIPTGLSFSGSAMGNALTDTRFAAICSIPRGTTVMKRPFDNSVTRMSVDLPMR